MDHDGAYAKKSRKPYTLTKQRESWTNEEHARFIKALQLYNRDWKKIESYVGNKTVVQVCRNQLLQQQQQLRVSHSAAGGPAVLIICRVSALSPADPQPRAKILSKGSQIWRGRGSHSTTAAKAACIRPPASVAGIVCL